MSNQNEDEVEEVFSQDETYEDLKSLIACDSQELTEILESSKQAFLGPCSFPVKKEVEVPMSPPMTPTPAPYEPLYFHSPPIDFCGIVAPERSDALVPMDFKFAAKTGRYNFHVHFEEERRPPAKSCNSTYSKQLNKLYVQREVPISIEFRTSIDLPSCAEIRAYLVYDDSRHLKEVVEQCPVHVKDVAEPAHKGHLLRTTDVTNSSYEQCPVTRRFVCSTIYNDINQPTSIVETYKLSCLTTCRGGINRRPVSALFSLFVKGSCQGQAKISVHSCACPGRDRKSQEAKDKERSKKKQPAPSSSATASSSSTAPSTSCPPSKRLHSDSSDHDGKGLKIKVSRKRSSDDDDQWYNVTVRVFGKRPAQKVLDIAEAFNASSAYRRLMRGINTSSSYKNGPLLTNKRLRSTYLPALFDTNDSNEEFEKLKSKWGVKSTVLGRSQSDPTTGYTAMQRRMQLNQLSFFEKD